jgi:hypothetical protein
MNVFLKKKVLVNLLIFLCFNAYSQSKKEQIKFLTQRVDSLNHVLDSNRILNQNQINELYSVKTKLENRINLFTIEVSKLSSDLNEKQVNIQQKDRELADLRQERDRIKKELTFINDSLVIVLEKLRKLEFKHLNESSENLKFENPEIDEISSEQKMELLKFFKSATVNEFVSAMSLLRGAKTDKEFESAYKNFQPLFSKMENELTSNEDNAIFWTNELSVFEGIFAIVPSCVAECTVFKFSWNIFKLEKAALNTSGTFDERFFQMKYTYECDKEDETALFSPQWPNIFERTWDYGGHVLVGDSLAYNLLKFSWEYQNETDLFKSFILELRADIIENLGHSIYLYTRSKVQSELNSIFNSTFTNSSEKLAIKKIIERNNKSGAKSSPKLQFDCKSNNCDYGG